MAMRILAVAFAVAGAACWLWPGAFVGWLFPALPVSVRESKHCSSLERPSYGSSGRRTTEVLDLRGSAISTKRARRRGPNSP